MPGERLSMRQIREVLRQRFASKLPQRAIAKSLGLSQGAVSGYLSRARAASVVWPLSEDLDDAQLEALLFPLPPVIASDQRPLPDWAWVHRELRRPDVTLALLWEEYRAGAPDGFGYSWYCDLYRAWAGRLKPTMRQTHIAGEKLFVDFAGRTGEVVDGRTGEIIPVQIFVAVLGASSFTSPRRCGTRSCRTGSPRMSAPLRISAAPPGTRSATISRPASPRPAFTSRRSIGPQPPLGQALCRPGPALRHRDRPGTPLQAQGQGQSRGRGAGGRALDSGAVAAPALLRAGRTQRGDPGPARRGQQPPDARLGHEPAGALRSVGPAGARVAATLSLRIRRVEALSRQPRLPRRDRQALLQRAAPADPPGGRGADHHDDSRGFPPRQARRQPPPQPATAPPDHRRRTHAQFAPALSRLDTRAHPPRSRSSRPRRRRAGRGDFAVAAASRTGLPLLHRHPAPGQALWRRTGRCRLRPCAGARHPLLQLGRRDPEEPPRAS